MSDSFILSASFLLPLAHEKLPRLAVNQEQTWDEMMVPENCHRIKSGSQHILLYIDSHFHCMNIPNFFIQYIYISLPISIYRLWIARLLVGTLFRVSSLPHSSLPPPQRDAWQGQCSRRGPGHGHSSETRGEQRCLNGTWWNRTDELACGNWFWCSLKRWRNMNE